VTTAGLVWRVLQLPEGLDAPAVARRWLLAGMTAAPPDLAETAVLLVSELVTNTVLYGAPVATARMRQSAGTIEVIVTDCGETVPVAPGTDRPDPHQLGGRGLFMVAELADEWGIEPLQPGPGKAVWFRLSA
jgi:anti-sigma regulatory factor (Ser/Thr protein kinase)